MYFIFSVYKHTAPNGKVYIGITSIDVKKRWCNGKGYAGNKHFSNAVAMYGWENFEHEVLFEGLTKEEACEKEITLISLYNANDREYGYNRGTGGEFGLDGVPRTKEWGDKISKSKRGEKHPLFGKKHSEETKKKMSNSNLGKHAQPFWAVEKRRKPVLKISADGEIIQKYESAAEAERANNCSHIADVCNGIRTHSAGYKWKYI